MKYLIFLFLLSCQPNEATQESTVVEVDGQVIDLDLEDDEDCDEKAEKKIQKIMEDPSLDADEGCTLE